MKKILLLGIVVIAFSACTSKQKLEDAENRAEATRGELVAALADRDQLLELVGEISSGMEQIKQLENILSVSGNNETPGQKEKIRADIAAIQRTLQERRQKLEELEAKLSSSSKTNAALKQTITTLRAQIDEQTQEISSLRTSLGDARLQIDSLDAKVDSLSNVVTESEVARELANQQNEELTNELNICYYAIGTKSELKENKIIETGFLRKTKLLKGDFDHNFFTAADKRQLSALDLNSDKADILTNHPAGSYVISQGNGHKTLQITNPNVFWSLSNYLVIKID
ncbi:MAG: hypothetical protein J1F05_04565 [Muribaculaceae bacterium]|nr:hypothetical protein [Muribaculaceae bacterium]